MTPTPIQTPAEATTGNWNEQKTKLKAKFPSITDAVLHYENGKKDAMMEKLQLKLGKSKDELTTIIAAL